MHPEQGDRENGSIREASRDITGKGPSQFRMCTASFLRPDLMGTLTPWMLEKPEV
jgi:hypothetical protein